MVDIRFALLAIRGLEFRLLQRQQYSCFVGACIILGLMLFLEQESRNGLLSVHWVGGLWCSTGLETHPLVLEANKGSYTMKLRLVNVVTQ